MTVTVEAEGSGKSRTFRPLWRVVLGDALDGGGLAIGRFALLALFIAGKEGSRIQPTSQQHNAECKPDGCASSLRLLRTDMDSDEVHCRGWVADLGKKCGKRGNNGGWIESLGSKEAEMSAVRVPRWCKIEGTDGSLRTRNRKRVIRMRVGDYRIGQAGSLSHVEQAASLLFGTKNRVDQSKPKRHSPALSRGDPARRFMGVERYA